MLVSQAVKARVWETTNLALMSPKKLKKMIREGIPQSLRRSMWLQLSCGQLAKQQAPEGYFAALNRK